MTLGRMQSVLQRSLRRPCGRVLTVLLILAVVATGFPRLEAHAHMQGELPHATMVHQGSTFDHDHHAGHSHALDEPHDAGGSGSAPHDTVQHLHLLPHVVALPASVNAVPVVRAATASMAPRQLIAPATRPEKLFRPPIR